MIGLPYHFQITCGLAEGIFLHVDLAVAMYLGTKIVAQRIHTADSDTVKTTRHLIGSFVELAARMQHRQHHLKCLLMHLLVHVDRDASTVINHFYRIVAENRHFYMIGKSGKRLIYRVIDHLIHKVMQTSAGDVADIHRRTLAHRLKTLKDLDIIRHIIFLTVFLEGSVSSAIFLSESVIYLLTL